MSVSSLSSSAKLKLSTELRRLSLKDNNKLINILNRNSSWKELAGVITNPDVPNKQLFTGDDISTLEMQWKNNSSPAEALLQFWSTYGKVHPTVKDLLSFLKKADLLRALTDVRALVKDFDGEIVGTDIPSISVQVDSCKFSEIDAITEALSEIDLNGLVLFSYQEMRCATKDFCDLSIRDGGYKIGEGAYGTVYKAMILHRIVAVKKLKDPIDKQFVTELKVLTRYKHENLLPLLGFSFNGPNCCLVYAYMKNGSLQERLACIGDVDPLSCSLRLSIAYGSALGINYLHTFEETPMVHRDIKSANILLDENFVPKVGDFGLVRTGSTNISTTMAVTENVYGTCIYMAREAFYGDVSVKLDTYSFGVVLLELLTGLPPYDTSREDRDLITYMEGCDDILPMLDSKVQWNEDAAVKLYDIAKKCLAESKRNRPAMCEILDDLKHLDNEEEST